MAGRDIPLWPEWLREADGRTSSTPLHSTSQKTTSENDAGWISSACRIYTLKTTKPSARDAMFRAKGSTREVVGRPQWPAIETIEEPSVLSPSDVPDDPAEAPVDKNERGWTRWPVAIFAALVYWPIIRPLDAFLSNPTCFLLLLVVFLYGIMPYLITSGLLSNVMAGKEAKIHAL